MTYLWLLWIALFAVLEAYAIKSPKTGDTLSEHVWEWFGIDPHGRKRRGKKHWSVGLRRFSLLAFMAWLSVHFLTGGAF